MTGASGTSSSYAAVVPRVKVFVNDQHSDNVIRQALADLGVEDFTATTGNATTARMLLAKQPSPRLLLVDLTGLDDPVASIQELAEVCEPCVSVVAIGTSNDITLYRQLKNAGVAEYFFKPLIPYQVVRCCNDILSDTDRSEQDSPFAGKLVVVLGVRGGVGATTLAASAAWHLSEIRQRWTILLDFDMQNGDTALLFDATPGQALREAFEHPERVDKLFLERGAIHVTKRLNLLASLEPLGSTVEGSEEAIGTLLDSLLHRYRAVIIDLPCTVAVYLPQILQRQSTCVLVANGSLAAARDMARWREHIGPNTRERRTLHVLNRTSAHGGLSDAEFARASGQAPDIVIPYDRELADAATFGARAMQKCSIFRDATIRVLQGATGEPFEKRGSIFKRVFSR